MEMRVKPRAELEPSSDRLWPRGMTPPRHDTYGRPSRLLWVGVIALTAAVITTWLRTESLPLTLGFGIASALISMAIVWFIDWTRRPP